MPGIFLKGVKPVKLSITLPGFSRMPEFGFKQVGQSDTLTERMIQIITNDTDHPFSFPEGRQTFISKPHPADEHAPAPILPWYRVLLQIRANLQPAFCSDTTSLPSGKRPHSAGSCRQSVYPCCGMTSGTSLKVLKSSANHASNRKLRGCGGRDFISVILAISEGESTPRHT